nr:unnamed protein product [Callosobruchus analis]
MHDQRAPIVVVSEDYLDQRDDPQKILRRRIRLMSIKFRGKLPPEIKSHEGSVLKSQSDISSVTVPEKVETMIRMSEETLLRYIYT